MNLSRKVFFVNLLILQTVLLCWIPCQSQAGIFDDPTIIADATPSRIRAKQPVILQWSTTDAKFVTINHGIGKVEPEGSITVTPRKTTTYTISAHSSSLSKWQHEQRKKSSTNWKWLRNWGHAKSSVTITVVPYNINSAPSVDPQEITINEDTSSIITLTGSDPENDPFTFQVTTDPTHGTLSGIPPQFTYTPQENFNGTDSFTVVASDDRLTSPPTTINITVLPVNDTPVASDDTLETQEDTPLAIVSLIDNDTDVDEDPLSITTFSQPTNGTLSFSSTTILTYIPNPNFHGTDEFTYTISDSHGGEDSATATLTITSVNDTPVASAGNDKTVYCKDHVDLDGSASFDIDGDPLIYQWSFVSVPAGSTAILDTVAAIKPSFTADQCGTYVVQLTVNDSIVESAPATVKITAEPRQVNVPGIVNLSQPDAEAAILKAGLRVGSIGHAQSDTVPEDLVMSQSPKASETVDEGTAVSFVLSMGPESVVPVISFTASPTTIALGEQTTISWSSTNATNISIDNGIGLAPLNGSMQLSPEHTTTYTITANNLKGAANAMVTVMVSGPITPQPAGAYGTQYEDLIPTDSTVPEYAPKRFALITGLITDINDVPLADIRVTMQDHPEYGTVFTDTDGRYTLPVQGGNTMTVVFRKDNFITSQRQVYVPWNDIAITEPLQLIQEDNKTTTVTFDGNPNTHITHTSTEIVDAFGRRSTTMIFTGDNSAYVVDEEGTEIQELSTITTRATEYVTPESMPAVLPPNSAYTYCTELKVDGVERVRFAKPVTIYVDNFLGFAVGESVPVGYYDRDRALWVPSDNGVVVMLLDTDNDGTVDALDADGDGLADDLNSNGSYADEVIGLDAPLRYSPGATFWRVAVSHFTPWDTNWPPGPPADSIYPNPKGMPDPEPSCDGLPDCKQCINSYISKRDRVFHEDIPIPGTDMTLHYSSKMVKGYKQIITIPASGDTVPASLESIVVEMEIAGRKLSETLEPLPNQVAQFTWDGLDHLGRHIDGTINAQVAIGFSYQPTYYSSRAASEQSFGQPGSIDTWIDGRNGITKWKRYKLAIQEETEAGTMADGWTLSTHHFLDPNSRQLTKGDSSHLRNSSQIITTVAGSTIGYSGDNDLATEAKMNWPFGIAIDPKGNIFIADKYNHRIRKVDPNGIITTVAGTGVGDLSGDNGLATEATLYQPTGVALDLEGNLFIADYRNQRVRKVDTSGIITTVAGNNIGYFNGDDIPATEAGLFYPHRVTIDPTGNLFIADTQHDRIRKVDTSGIISTVAGSDQWGSDGDGGAATEAELNYPCGIAIDPAGKLFIADAANQRIRKVGLVSGFDSHLAEEGDIPFADDNGLGYIMSATGLHKKTINLETGLVLREFSYDENDNLISIIDQFGNTTTLEWLPNDTPTAIISPDGIRTELYVDDNNHLKQVVYPDNSAYDFTYTADGLMTVEAEPNGNLFQHTFDANGRIAEVLDQEGGHWQYFRQYLESGEIQIDSITGEGNRSTNMDHAYSTGAISTTTIDPSDDSSEFSRSSDGLTEEQTMASGMSSVTKFGIDSEYGFKFPKEISVTSPAGLSRISSLEKTYEDVNDDGIPDIISRTRTINDRSTVLTHNVSEASRTATSPLGRTVTELYDPATMLTSSLSVPGFFDITYGYDSSGHLTIIDKGSRQATFTYNAQGLLDSSTDPLNRTSTYSYDQLGRVTSTTRPDNSIVSFAYDANGNMTVLTTPTPVDHNFTYTKVNKKSGYQTPLQSSYSYVYDRDRRLVEINFPSQKQITNIFDKNRLSQVITPESTIDFTYLPGSRLSSVTRGTEAITYTYDGALPLTETLAGTLNQSLTYSYYNDFSLASMSYADNSYSFAYDQDNQLIGIGNFSITRNIDSGFPEMVSGGTMILSRDFNDYGELSFAAYTTNGIDSFSWDVTRDANGSIASKTETIEGGFAQYVYTYDLLGRLLTVTQDNSLVEEYRYDNNGNRIYEMNTLRNIPGKTSSYSVEDHILQSGSTSFVFDYDDNLAEIINGNETIQYNYSSTGGLLNVILPDGTTIDYLHDALGRRVAKLVNDTVVEKYLWAGLTTLLAVYDGNDNLLQRFEYADDRVPYAMTSGGYTYYMAYDQVGTLRTITDSSGTVIKRIDYDSFGNIVVDTNPDFTVPFGFAGGLHDRDTGLVRFGLRDYSPEIGRWTAKDPILFAGGDTNLYGYVLNDPVNFVDPLGLEYKHVTFGHDTSGNSYISYHGRRVATYDGNQWVANDGTPIDGNRSSLMSNYEARGEIGDMCEIASDVAKEVAGAAVEEAAKNIHPAVAIPVKAINYIFGATPAY